ncbi:glutamate-cysteine ligase modifier subunit [Xylona heveae TC161]|uniref:GCS light chain n=1 Tax=Xylona heveae (strain CBS 132557 / TC161) TaxID=1328760 RepID=A0A165HIQ6_XYLHT|nr:glutamate-cysteine ligase modifier subunit [Xylona heveae TC161]KZF23579.1 glutamate-cysteine ligase modifier subunit [Xylona heveae TC161]
MTKLILSTSNIINDNPLIGRPSQKSNTELTNSLRANFQHSQHQQAFTPPHAEQNGTSSEPSASDSSNGVSISPSSSQVSISTWTTRDDDNGIIYVPSIDFSQSGLAEERAQYDITVKLFYLPGIPVSERCKHTREAIDLVLKELGVSSIDLLIVSFPGIAFDAEDAGDESNSDDVDEADVSGAASGVGIEDISSMITTWRVLEELHAEGLILRLGLAEFGSQRLTKFLAQTRVRPSVDQINVRDCCVVPKPLILLARQEKIELLTHNDCMNILPSGTLRELLGPEEKGGVGLLPGSANEERDRFTGDLAPQWVVKYTAVVKDRGVVENKGYFAVAELQSASQ